MICPDCGLECRVDAAGLEGSGDASPDTATLVQRVQRLVCRNPRCTRHGREVTLAKNTLYRSDA